MSVRKVLHSLLVGGETPEYSQLSASLHLHPARRTHGPSSYSSYISVGALYDHCAVSVAETSNTRHHAQFVRVPKYAHLFQRALILSNRVSTQIRDHRTH